VACSFATRLKASRKVSAFDIRSRTKTAAHINRAAYGVFCSPALMPNACKYQGFAEFIQVLYITWGIMSSCRKSFGFECAIL
jgi:hypothetical protein